jgi:3-phytase
VHPTDPAQSTIIGTDKQGGLAVYDLEGREIQYLANGLYNNVDIRDEFLLGGTPIALVTANDRATKRIAIYRVNPSTRLLENVSARAIRTSGLYGACMFHSSRSGKFYYFGTRKVDGLVEQWLLFDDGAGRVDAKLVRTFVVGSQTEGCVADDEQRKLYISEEAVGIWKYGAEPHQDDSRTLVDSTGAGGHLDADVEGLAIAYEPDGSGYLIASSQGNDTFTVYRRDTDNAFVKRFQIVAGSSVDGVTKTDGIDVTTSPLGSLYPYGLFVAQDDENDDGNQNFKLVPWQRIMSKLAITPTPTAAP